MTFKAVILLLSVVHGQPHAVGTIIGETTFSTKHSCEVVTKKDLKFIVKRSEKTISMKIDRAPFGCFSEEELRKSDPKGVSI